MTVFAAVSEAKNNKVYDAINRPVLELVPRTAKRILDVGCGSGTFGGELKSRMNCEVIGLTHSEAEAALAMQQIDQVVVCDLDNFDPKSLGTFDCIVFSHVLEHLNDPWSLLKNLRDHLDQSGVMIVALPNVLNIKQRLEFLRGKFKYQEFGLMDRTHLRFFDWDTCYDMVRDAGLAVEVRTATGFFPLAFLRKPLGRTATTIDGIASRWLPRLFAFQFLLVARRI